MSASRPQMGSPLDIPDIHALVDEIELLRDELSEARVQAQRVPGLEASLSKECENSLRSGGDALMSIHDWIADMESVALTPEHAIVALLEAECDLAVERHRLESLLAGVPHAASDDPTHKRSEEIVQ